MKNIKIRDRVLFTPMAETEGSDWWEGIVYDIESNDVYTFIYSIRRDMGHDGFSQNCRRFAKDVRLIMTESDVDDMVDL